MYKILFLLDITCCVLVFFAVLVEIFCFWSNNKHVFHVDAPRISIRILSDSEMNRSVIDIDLSRVLIAGTAAAWKKEAANLRPLMAFMSLAFRCWRARR